MDIRQDESLQGWICRLLIRNDNAKFHLIIGSNGMWHKTPQLPQELSYYYKVHCDNELLNILNRSGIGRKEQGIFDEPQKYNEALKTVFSGEETLTSSTKGQVSIAYCPECISESIVSNGYSYFHSGWLNEKYCIFHKKPLYILPQASRVITEQNIKFLLGGAVIGKYYELSTLSPKKKDTAKPGDEKELLSGHDSPVNVQPCLLLKFEKWLLHKVRGLSSVDDSIGGVDKYRIFHRNRNYKYISVSEMMMIFVDFIRDETELMKVFLLENAEVDNMKFGFQCGDSFNEKITKLKGRNCSFCSEKENTFPCAKRIIIKIWSFDIYTGIDFINPCDFFRFNRTHYWSDARPFYINGERSTDYRYRLFNVDLVIKRLSECSYE